MLDFIIGLISLVAALGVVLLRKVYFSRPLYELKRQAIKGDTFSSSIYPLVAHGAILRGFLWFLLAVFSALCITLFNQIAPLWIGIVLVIIYLWLIFSWMPNRPPRKLSQGWALLMVPVLVWIINAIYPIIRKLENLAGLYTIPHSGIYEVDDLLYSLSRQLVQADNRIKAHDITRIEQILALDHLLVGDYMLPIKDSMTIAADELIGPKLLDDLHRSQQTSFLVTRNKRSHQLIGVLNREDVGLKSDGKVGDFMHSPIRFINENESIEKALTAFASHSQSLMVVVNKDKQLLGVLSLKNALAILLGSHNKMDLVEDSTELVDSLDIKYSSNQEN